MVACDGNCASLRSSEVALVLLCTYLDAAVNRLNSSTDNNMSNMPTRLSLEETPNPAHQMLRLVELAAELRKMCKVNINFFLIKLKQIFRL